VQIIILAAGKGNRMKSDLPKVMHLIGEKPMLEHVVANCYKISRDLVLVYSDHIKDFLPQFSDRCELVKQEEQLGTAHAVYIAQDKFKNDQPIAVIYGDNPLITSRIIKNLFDHMKSTGSKVVTLAFEYDKPNAYGRIIVDSNGNFKKIVEAKCANPEEKKVTLCNSGIMCFAPGILKKYIGECLKPDIDKPEQELYLTKIIEICAQNGETVTYCVSEHQNLVLGVNTQEELKEANLIIDKVS
jgi:bifunctional N-acetylglucosamine-1-phosphate-uridyltransferase/glucosamine-1-phosphate-acetyltransferase GlmU-like protein